MYVLGPIPESTCTCPGLHTRKGPNEYKSYAIKVMMKLPLHVLVAYGAALLRPAAAPAYERTPKVFLDHAAGVTIVAYEKRGPFYLAPSAVSARATAAETSAHKDDFVWLNACPVKIVGRGVIARNPASYLDLESSTDPGAPTDGAFEVDEREESMGVLSLGRCG